MSKEEETDCIVSYLRERNLINDWKYFIKTRNADCKTFMENLLSETLDQGVDRAILRLSNYKIFEKRDEAEMEEKLFEYSSECLREKLSELNYSELLLSKTTLFNQKPNAASMIHFDFERKSIVALLVCSADITFDVMFDELIQNSEEERIIEEEFDDQKLYCLRKSYFNETLNEIDFLETNGLEDYDCSEYFDEFNQYDASEELTELTAMMVFGYLSVTSEPCIEWAMKDSTVGKFLYKFITMLGLKLNEDFKKSEKENYVKIMTKFTVELLPCIWDG